MLKFPAAQKNDPAQKGCLASRKMLFGSHKRYALAAVHTRFDAVQWFVWDAETEDEVMSGPAIIRQEDTPAQAVVGLLEEEAV